MIAALICARDERGTNSPGRNTVPVLGRPVVAYPLLATAHATLVDRVFLSTDSAEIVDIAQRLGIEIIERPDELCADNTPFPDVIRHALAQIAGRTGSPVEMLALLLGNAPTIAAGTVDPSRDGTVARPETHCSSGNRAGQR